MAGENNLLKATFLAELLTCKFCKNVARSPIFQCKKGHFVCSICKDKDEDGGVEKCPTCNSTNWVISSAAENLAERFEDLKVPCPTLGCQEMLKYTGLEDHTSNKCYFRSIICNGQPNCKDTPVPMHQFYKHWTDLHRQFVYNDDNKTSIKPKVSDDGKVFIVHTKGSSIWVTKLGSPQSAAEYEWKFTLHCYINDDAEPPQKLSRGSNDITPVPILAYHDAKEFDKTRVGCVSWRRGSLKQILLGRSAQAVEEIQVDIVKKV